MKLTLLEVKNAIEQLAEKINAPQNLLPTYGYPIDQGRTDIEIDDNGQICFFSDERSRERYLLRDKDDLLYYVFNRITQTMAVKDKSTPVIDTKDPRRIWFVKQELLLGILNENWKAKKIKEHEQLLINHPFRG